MATYSTFDPSATGTAMTLSGGNLTCTHSGTDIWNLSKSTLSKAAGKWYWEITVTFSVNVWGAIVGLCNASADKNSFIGVDANSGGYQSDGTFIGLTGTAASYPTGTVIGVAFDAGGQTVQFYKNNVLEGTLSTTGLGSTLFAAAGVYRSGDSFVANFGATALTYTPPTGYNAGLYDAPAINSGFFFAAAS